MPTPKQRAFMLWDQMESWFADGAGDSGKENFIAQVESMLNDALDDDRKFGPLASSLEDVRQQVALLLVERETKTVEHELEVRCLKVEREILAEIATDAEEQAMVDEGHDLKAAAFALRKVAGQIRAVLEAK